MGDLHNNPDITVIPADKGGSIVIMNTVDYVKESQRQLFSQEHYKTLHKDLYNSIQQIDTSSVIDQTWRMEIIDKTTKVNLQTKNSKNIIILPFT